MSLSWTHQIAKALAVGRPTPALELHLDVLLVWLSNPDNPRAAELERAIIRQGLARAEAGASAYRLLDQQLFAGDAPPSPAVLGFASGIQAAQAKQRYRRLMQVYHPDRHPDRAVWATRRTEQINRAFAAFERGESGTARPARRKQQRTRRDSAGATSRRLPPAWLPSAFRDLIAPAWVWTHDRYIVLTPLQQRLLNTAAILFVLICTITFWPREPPKPVPRIIHHPLGVEPMPVPLSVEPEQKPEPEPEKPQSVASITPAAKPVPAVRETPPPGVALETPAAVDPRLSAAPTAPEPADRSPAQPVTAPIQQQPLADTAPRSRPAPQPGLPSAATPVPPRPPARPETPQAPGAAPAVSGLPLTGASSDTQCRSVPETLRRFQIAYQNGALDPLMALYSPLAKENALETWFAIRQTYAEWFRTTSARRIDFEQIQIQPIADSQRCALMAVFQVSYLDRQSRQVTQSGIIELLLERRDSGWLILRARY